MGAVFPSALLAGVLAGLTVAMPLGAVGMYLVGLAARQPGRTSASAALGVATTDGLYALAASVGGVALAHILGAAEPVLRLCAAVVLLGLAVRTLGNARRSLAKPPQVGRTSTTGAPRAYLTLVALTAVNPATILTFSAVVLGRSWSDLAWSGTAWFTAGAFTASAVWHLLLVTGGSLLGRVLSGRRGQFAVAVTTALLMLALAVAVLLT